MFNFDKQFFEKHQKSLLLISNKWYLRWLLGLNRLPKDLKGKQIDKITPNSIHHIIESKLTKKGKFKKYKITAEFFSRPRFAEALAYNLSPLCYFQSLRSQKMVWRFSPVGLAYILLFSLFGKLAGLQFIFIGTTNSYYAGTGDGYIYKSGTDFATIRAASTGTAVYYTATYTTSVIRLNTSASAVTQIHRSFIPVDTSGLTSSANISAASWFLRGSIKGNTCGSPNLHICAASQSSTSSLSTSDYSAISDTSFGNIAYASYSVSGYNEIALNANGISNINKTDYSKFGVRTHWDINNDTTGISYVDAQYSSLSWRSSDYTGTSSDPYLSVTYTVSSTSIPKIIII